MSGSLSLYAHNFCRWYHALPENAFGVMMFHLQPLLPRPTMDVAIDGRLVCFRQLERRLQSFMSIATATKRIFE